MIVPTRFPDDAVEIIEVGPRDGLQNEPTTVPTDVKVELIERLLASGIRAIELTSYVRPDRIPQLADAADVTAGMAIPTDVRAIALVPNLHGLARVNRRVVNEVAVFAAASETFSRRNLNCGIDESLEMFAPVIRAALDEGLRVRAYVSTALGCPFEGDVPVGNVCRLVEALLAAGCHEISIGDTIGVGTPGAVFDLVESLSRVAPLDRLAMHMHDTYGQGLANCTAAYAAGVRRFDSSIGGLGGCPFAGAGGRGKLATEDLVYALHGSGVATGIDMDALVATSRWLGKHLGRELPSRVAAQLARRSDAAEH